MHRFQPLAVQILTPHSNFLRKPRTFEIKQQLAHSLLLYLYKKGCHDETSNR